MRLLPCLMAVTLIVAGGAASAAKPVDPEARIARALAGRVAGKPVDCIQLRDIRSSQIVDRTAIIYETNGGRMYLNRPASGASSLDWNDILLTDTHSPQLCSIDTVRLIDRGSNMQSGFVGLGKFVPYTKASKGRASY